MNEKRLAYFRWHKTPGGAQDWNRARNRTLEHTNDSEKETGQCRYVDTQMIRKVYSILCMTLSLSLGMNVQ
jgi:hypothetical protein